MMVLLTLIKTNLRRLASDRGGSLVVLFLPSLLFLLAGLAYESGDVGPIPISVYVASENGFSDGFLSSLGERGFRVEKAGDELDCAQNVKLQRARGCLTFGYESPPNITFYVDYTNMHIASDIQESFNAAAGEYSDSFGQNYTVILADRLRAAKKEVDASRPVIVTFATQQDQVNKKLDAITGSLQDIKVELDPEIARSLSTKLNASNLVSLFRSINDLKTKVDSEISFAASNISRELDLSAISETDKQRIKQVMYDVKERVRNANDAFQVTTQVTQKDLDAFKSSTDQIIKDIAYAKEQMDKLDSLKSDARKSIRSLQADMNANLLQLIMMQNALNKISTLSDDPILRQAGDIYNPLPISIRPIAGSAKDPLQALYPSMMVLLLLLTGLLLGSTMFMVDAHSPAKARNAMMPVGRFTYQFGLISSAMILLLCQGLVMLGLVVFFIGIKSWIFFVYGFGILSLVSLLACLLGMAVASWFDSEEASSLLCMGLVFLFFILSDMVLPIESMPSYLAYFTAFNPLIVAGGILKRLLIFNLDLSTQVIPLMVLAASTILSGALLFFGVRRKAL